jgi:protein phosphatase 4 regulatory subunit 3
MFQNNVQRVKVYRLTNDGQWDDQGTGHITIDYIEVWSTLDSYLLETSSKMITAIFVSY